MITSIVVLQANATQDNQKNVSKPVISVPERSKSLEQFHPAAQEQAAARLENNVVPHPPISNVFQVARVSYHIESDKPADASVHFQNEKGETTHVEMTKLPFQYTYTKPFEQGEAISVRALNDTGATMTLSIRVDDELVASRVYFGYEMVIGDLIHFFL